MLIVKRFCNNYKIEIISIMLSAFAGVFAALGRGAAYCVWVPEGILTYCSEPVKIIVGSLLLPIFMIIFSIAYNDGRQKVICTIYLKLALEILLISVGININCFSPVFLGDLSALFFVSLDLILLLSLMCKKGEKAVSIGVLAAVTVVSIFTVVINRDSGAVLSYVFRSVYLFLVYLSAAVVICMSPCRDAGDNENEGTDEVRRAGRLLVLMIMIASAAIAAVSFVAVSGHMSSLINDKVTASVACCYYWFFLYLLFVSFFIRKDESHSLFKNIVFSVCVALAATVTFVLLNSYGLILEDVYWYGEQIQRKLFEVAVKDAFFSAEYGWLRYPFLFVTAFSIALIFFLFQEQDNAPAYNGLLKNKGKLVHVDFENKVVVNNLAGERFSEDCFTIDGKEYDILLTFDNKEKKGEYIVCTDNLLDEDGKIHIFTSELNPESD